MYFLRKRIFPFLTTIQLSSVIFLRKGFFLLSQPPSLQIISLSSQILFVQCIFFDAQSVPKFTSGNPSRWLLCLFDMSLQVLSTWFFFWRKKMFRAYFVLFLSWTWNCLFLLGSLSSSYWGMVFGNQHLSASCAHW